VFTYADIDGLNINMCSSGLWQ